MDLGSGIALGGLCISTGAVLITAIRSSDKKPTNGNGNGLRCPDHSGVCVGIENIEEGLGRHEKWLGEISADVKKLLARK